MNCECKSRVEGLLLERFKEHKPDWKEHSVDVQGYEIGITKDLDLATTMGTQFVCAGEVKARSGDIKVKTLKQFIAFSFCPFCGESVKPKKVEAAADSAPANARVKARHTKD